MSLHVDIDTLKSLLNDFVSECAAKENYHDDLKDFKQHFHSWARIAVSHIRKMNQNGTTNRNRHNDADIARQQRFGAYAEHFANKLGVDTDGKAMH